MQPSRASFIYEFGHFRLDPPERTLMRDGESVPLVPKSFDMLCVLVQNSGRLLDKGSLLKSVWPDAAVEENSLARAIADIRRALGEGPRENRFIATIPRRGYRFVAKVTNSTATAEAGPITEWASAAWPLAGERIRSLAVLPFAWLTQEGRDGSLAVGLADALITRLSNLTQIVVRPTSSILKYAERDTDPAAIASELKVDFVVSGSLQQASERVRVTVQMVSPTQQRSVWADHFEETFTHVFSVEDSISDRVTAALALKLTHSQKESLARHNTENSEAYQLYLRGRYFWSKQTFPGAQKAIGYFRQALELDPQYALAWVGIADAYILIGLSGALTGGQPPHEIYPEAKRAALKAIELDDALGQAHTSLGFIKFFYDWDSRGAQQEFNQALTLRPHCAVSRHGYALTCGFLQRYDEALRQIDAALEIEPLSLILNANKGYLLYIARRYDESLMQLQKTLEIDPSFAPTQYRLGLTFAAKNMYREAIQHLEEAQRLSEDNPHALGALGYLYGQTCREAAAYRILRRLTKISKTRYVSAATMAEVQTGLRRYDEALAWLESGVRERTGALVTLRVDPRFECLRSEPRFLKVIQNLPS